MTNRLLLDLQRKLEAHMGDIVSRKKGTHIEIIARETREGVWDIELRVSK